MNEMLQISGKTFFLSIPGSKFEGTAARGKLLPVDEK
jgi:hypothetical protein